MKVLLPIDGSPYTEKMLNYIGTLSDIFRPEHEYVLITVVTPLLPQSAGMLGKETVEEYYKETASKVLQPAAGILKKKGLECNTGFKIGYVSEALAEEVASGDYGLIVMGTHGHGSLGSLVLGSVAHAMLSKTTIPVLLIR